MEGTGSPPEGREEASGQIASELDVLDEEVIYEDEHDSVEQAGDNDRRC
jgi:hypothetical protein